MSEIYEKPLKLEPVGFINETPSENRMTNYLLFGGYGDIYKLEDLYWTSSKEDAIRGSMRSQHPNDVIKTLFLVEFDLKSYSKSITYDGNSNVDSDSSSVFHALKDKKFYFESEQFMSFCMGENPKNIDLIFSTEDYDGALVSGVVSSLNFCNTFLSVFKFEESSYNSDKILFTPEKVNAFVLNN